MGSAELTTFNAPEGLGSVRVVVESGKHWFLVKDVGDCLELKKHNQSYHHHLHSLSKDEITSTSNMEVSLPGTGMWAAKWVSESGLYKLIMRSNKPSAKRFQDWVAKDVLPAIRKDGAYVMGEEKVVSGELSEDEFVLRAS